MLILLGGQYLKGCFFHRISSHRMIRKILSSQQIDNQNYYLVEWGKQGRKPSWVTSQACPQVAAFLAKRTHSSLPAEDLPQGTSLPGEITEDQPIFRYLNWRSQRMVEEKQEIAGEYKTKLQEQGTPRYAVSMIEKLQQKRLELNQQCLIKNPANTRLDYLIDNVQGVQLSRFKKLCFVVSIVGKSSRYVIPVKKMKKHFPQTLSDYLTNIIQVHREKDYQDQLAEKERQAQLQRQQQLAEAQVQEQQVLQVQAEEPSLMKKKSSSSLSNGKKKRLNVIMEEEEQWDIAAIMRNKKAPSKVRYEQEDDDDLSSESFGDSQEFE